MVPGVCTWGSPPHDMPQLKLALPKTFRKMNMPQLKVAAPKQFQEYDYDAVESYLAKHFFTKWIPHNWNLHAKNFHKMNIPQLKLAGPKTFHENEGGRFGKYWEVSHSWKLPRQKLLTKMKPQMDEHMATLNCVVFIHKFFIYYILKCLTSPSHIIEALPKRIYEKIVQHWH